ncbi:MAG: pyruvate kinase [Dehalococcoidia bacterium]|nr:pyruvate kinase [Dehalococcoidia bacterium]
MARQRIGAVREPDAGDRAPHKIVATLGPASQNAERIAALIEAGANVFRLNFSHGTRAQHELTFETIHEVAHGLGRTVAVLGDLQGPKIRTGDLAVGTVRLAPGAAFIITTRNVPGDAEAVSTSFQPLPTCVAPGQRLLLSDGQLALGVEAVDRTDVRCTVLVGGELREHAGINLPDLAMTIPSLTEKDEVDLDTCLDLGVDYVALSFVQRAEDVKPLRAHRRLWRSRVPVIAKIEKRAAIDHLAAIVRAFDGVMVARCDLAVETSAAEVPVFQKRIIQLALAAGKPVITATQMLESMTHSPQPTRAEASDVANAVWDGTDAVMLSAETAISEYPVETVETMAAIIRRATTDYPSFHLAPPAVVSEAEAVVHAAVDLASHINAAAILVLTRSGRTAQLVARERPAAPILAVTDNDLVRRQLALVWGVQPYLRRYLATTDDMLADTERFLLARGVLSAGNRIVVTGEAPVTARSRTNFIKLHMVR